MHETTLRAGCAAARATITAEATPRTTAEQQALVDVSRSLRLALASIGDRSVYQAVAKVLARHSLAGCPLLSRIPKDRRPLIAGRIARGFALAHIRQLESEKLLTKSHAEAEALLLSLCASLTLCEHAGDVGNDLVWVFKKLGIKVDKKDEDEEDGGIWRTLARMGIKTLHGTDLGDPDEENDQ